MNYIYGLVCPIDGTVKYIGVTKDIKARMRIHRTSKANKDVYKWTLKLKRFGKMFYHIVLDTDENRLSAYHKEQALIKEYTKTIFNINSKKHTTF